MKNYHFVLLSLLLSTTAIYAQNNCISISNNTPCAETDVVFSVVSPVAGSTYEWCFGSPNCNLADVTGTSATHVFPYSGGNQTIYLYQNGSLLCDTTIMVTPSPDPSIADQDVFEPFVQCNGNQTMTLVIDNISSTSNTNTLYEIDWEGDGTIDYNSSTLPNGTSHTYTGFGYFYLTITVHDNSTTCNSATRVYSVYNGAQPAIGLGSPPTVPSCSPFTLSFPINTVSTNTPGTIYDLYVGGQYIITYNHPPPSNFTYTFNKSSCGFTTLGGTPDAFDVQIIASNPCGPKSAIVSPITVSSPPIADFVQGSGCLGQTVLFDDLSSGANYIFGGSCNDDVNYTWSISPNSYTLVSGPLTGTGTVGTNDIQVQFNTATNYSVQLTVDNPCGQDVVTKTINIGNPPSAAATTGSSNSGCDSITVTYNNQSTDATGYSWTISPNNSSAFSFINGTTSASQNPTIKFTQAGTYIVQMEALGCIPDMWSDTITVEAAPNVSLNYSNSSCDSITITPFNHLTGDLANIDNFSWNLGANGTSSMQNPGTLTYNNQDTIVLMTTNGCGSDIDTIFINISAAQASNISSGDTTLCSGSGTLQLSAQPTGGTWSGGTVSSNGSFNPSGLGGTTNTITYGGNCLQTDNITITVIDNEISFAPNNPTGFCNTAQDTVFFNATPLGGIWSGSGIIDGNTGAFSANSAGNGALWITYQFNDTANSCIAIDSFQVNVGSLNFDFVVDSCYGTTICLDTTTNNISSPFTAIWDYGDTNNGTGLTTCHTYSSNGPYDVKLEVSSNGCVDSVINTITIAPPPVASFSLNTDEDCHIAEIIITDNSQGSGALSYVWHLNGNEIPLNLPIDTLLLEAYGQDSIYLLELTVSDGCNENTFTDTILVHPLNYANFGYTSDTICSGDTLVLNNLTIAGDTCFVDYGNGLVSNDCNLLPQVYFTGNQYNSVTIHLTTSNVCNSSDTSHTIIIEPTDVLALIQSPTYNYCLGDSVSLTGVGTLGAAHEWEMNDGNTYSGRNIHHVYQQSGTYNVILRAYGCGFDTDTIQISVYDLPNPDFAIPNQVCIGDTLTPLNLSDSTSIGFAWDFGDSTLISNQTEPSHVYQNIGAFPIRLSITNTTLLGNCPNSITQPIQVITRPSFQFNVSNYYPCVDESVIFESQINDYQLWDFGNGDKSADANTIRSFSTPGDYTIHLRTGINGYPCFNDTSFIITVFPIPNSNFDIEVLNNCNNPVLVECSTDTSGTNALEWFIDGISSSGQPSPIFEFYQSGAYQVTLIESNIVGCADTISKSVTVDIPPSVDILSFQQRGCIPFEVEFNTNTNADSCIIDYGDGTISYQCNGFHTYTDTGAFDIKITTISTECIVDTVIRVLVRPPLEIIASATPNAVILGESAILSVELLTDSIQVNNVIWMPLIEDNDRIICPTCPETDVFPRVEGDYNVIVVDEDNCIDSTSVYITVEKIPPYLPTGFTPNNDGNNDYFYPQSAEGLVRNIKKFQIFDRWGNKMFYTQNIESNIPSLGWNGTSNGEDAPGAIYVYLIEVEFEDGSTEIFAGDVTLIR
jgi:gliding motility-associated-like protein